MDSKETSRQRRAKKARMNIKESGRVRLAVHRTPRHIYAQVLSGDGLTTLAAASTVEKAIQAKLAQGNGNKAAATLVGQCVAERALKVGITELAFDRSGYLYHGRVKALADGARAAGLKF